MKKMCFLNRSHGMLQLSAPAAAGAAVRTSLKPDRAGAGTGWELVDSVEEARGQCLVVTPAPCEAQCTPARRTSDADEQGDES